MMVKTGQLVAHYLALDLATDRGDAARAEPPEQQYAHPIAHVRQGQGRRELLASVGCPHQEPDRDQGQRHVMGPALPGPPLVLSHPPLPFSSLETGFNLLGQIPRSLLRLFPGCSCRLHERLATQTTSWCIFAVPYRVSSEVSPGQL
jgi:hypothetical protein